MAFIVADRVRDTSTTTGTGPFTISGTAPSAYQTFSAALSIGDTFLGWIANQSANEWEVGLYTYSASNQITRTVVNASSNGGAAVVFTAGTKDVVLSPNALSGNLLFSDGTGFKSSETGTPNILLVNSVASASQWLELTNNTGTGFVNGPTLAAVGTETNISLNFRAKGAAGQNNFYGKYSGFLYSGGFPTLFTSQEDLGSAGISGLLAFYSGVGGAIGWSEVYNEITNYAGGNSRLVFDTSVSNTPHYLNYDGLSLSPDTDGDLDLGTTSFRWNDAYLKGYLELTEMAAPAAGAANTCRLFTQDNGAGKTQLMAIFNSGAAQQVAIQP
jgi:hypothetical protein